MKLTNRQPLTGLSNGPNFIANGTSNTQNPRPEPRVIHENFSPGKTPYHYQVMNSNIGTERPSGGLIPKGMSPTIFNALSVNVNPVEAYPKAEKAAKGIKFLVAADIFKRKSELIKKELKRIFSNYTARLTNIDALAIEMQAAAKRAGIEDVLSKDEYLGELGKLLPLSSKKSTMSGSTIQELGRRFEQLMKVDKWLVDNANQTMQQQQRKDLQTAINDGIFAEPAQFIKDVEYSLNKQAESMTLFQVGIDGENDYELENPKFFIGRDDSGEHMPKRDDTVNHVLTEADVSRFHASIEVNPRLGLFTIQDVGTPITQSASNRGSKNGTSINDTKIQAAKDYVAIPGDKVKTASVECNLVSIAAKQAKKRKEQEQEEETPKELKTIQGFQTRDIAFSFTGTIKDFRPSQAFKRDKLHKRLNDDKRNKDPIMKALDEFSATISRNLLLSGIDNSAIIPDARETLSNKDLVKYGLEDNIPDPAKTRDEFYPDRDNPLDQSMEIS